MLHYRMSAADTEDLPTDLFEAMMEVLRMRSGAQ
jgi:hypothetical protein